MHISALRILPPIAIGRLGSSQQPLDAYSLEVSPESPLDFRKIVPEASFDVDPVTGEMTGRNPDNIIFKDAAGLDDKYGTVRPLAPFLEVFAVTDKHPGQLVPLTTRLLEEVGLSLADISWNIKASNIKLYRRTLKDEDRISAEINDITTHGRIALEGKCPNFVTGKTLPLGHVQFIAPTDEFPEIRFRYTPGPGRVYGTSTKRIPAAGQKPVDDPIFKQSISKYDFLLYKETGAWFGYQEGNQDLPILTNPGAIFAGYDDDKAGGRVSWGYLDDECDGTVTVQLKNTSGTVLTASAHFIAGPPAYAPDTLPVRVITDEIEQILLGPDVDKEVPIGEAEDIIRRALETVRLMNTAIMNGNTFQGRERVASCMSAQDSNDFGRMYEPIMAPSLVDNLAVRAIHERVFNGLGTGANPWFENVLRRPTSIGDLSNEERRKMPAMMRNADGRALCFTYRQINTLLKSAASSMFGKGAEKLNDRSASYIAVNDLVRQLHHRGKGNPYSVLPRSAISNCFPGLECDFRNLWRRAFKGIVLIENNNFVVEADGGLSHLLHRRLVGVNGEPTMVPTSGPTFPRSGNLPLINTSNPNGVSFMEWSNNLAHVLQHQGKQIDCYFTKKMTDPITGKEIFTEVVVKKEDLNETNPLLEKVTLTVNTFFTENSAALSGDILQPGELTQGLCAPWQNDYRECACYYWAASRPDYVNVVPGDDGLSKGDTWMAKKRTGSYIPDDRTDSRLVSYDDLFANWEGELNFIVKGFDSLDSKGKNA